MIFYGRKASRLKDGKITNVTCPNCDTTTSMNYSIFGKYAYLYWIPTFPMGKENIIECNECKTTFKLNELPNQIKQKFELEKQNGYPIWYFSGLFIISLLIALAFYLSSQNDKNNKIYIEDPQVGDVYSITTEKNGYYSSLKISEIKNDSVFVIFNDYEIDKRSKIYKIDKDQNYTSDSEGYTKSELKDLFNKGIIYDIDRN